MTRRRGSGTWPPEECRRVLEGHTNYVYGVAFAPDASRLATASFDKTARIWSVADGRCLQTLQGHTKEVRSVAWSPDGKLLATGGFDRSIRLWSPDGTLSRNIENLDNRIISVIFTADSSELLYTWGGPELPVWRGGPAGLLGTGAGAIHQA